MQVIVYNIESSSEDGQRLGLARYQYVKLPKFGFDEVHESRNANWVRDIKLMKTQIGVSSSLEYFNSFGAPLHISSS